MLREYNKLIREWAKVDMSNQKLVPVKGSERTLPPDSTSKGPAPSGQIIEVRVTLKASQDLQQAFSELAAQPVEQRQYLTREQFASQFGATEDAVQKLDAFAQAHNLSVAKVDRAQNTVYLRGTVAEFNAAFHTSLEQFTGHQGLTFRARTGALQVPAELESVIESVNGLDDRPLATPKFRIRPPVTAHAAPNISYQPQDLAKLYSFPSIATPGKGQTVAIIELGGGYRTADLNKYFGTGTHPSVAAVSVDGGHNTPVGDPNSADGEVLLDIEVVGAVAPSAKIAVYFAPNTNKGFLDAISAAVHDTVRKPSVVSISWGSPEDGGGYSVSTLNAFNQVFQAAGVLGVTVLVAAGDNGSTDGLTGDHVDFPASSPYVTACGGTRLVSDAAKQTIQSETVWNDGAQGGATGGGVSKQFPVPSYQTGLHAAHTSGGTAPALTGRGVPDLAANADPVTGYNVLVDGQTFPIGGTSAVAPLLSGLVAILNQQLGKPVGFWNPVIYKLQGTAALRDITSGNNGTFAAAKGWDACTGLGAPVGTALLSELKGGGA